MLKTLASLLIVAAASAASVRESWDNHFDAFGAQDVDQILLDYTESSVITDFDHRTGVTVAYEGLAGVRTFFTDLFARLTDLSDLAAPVIEVREQEFEVFLVWSAAASGFLSATDTFSFDENFKITTQNVVSTSKVLPTAQNSVQASWNNHFAAFGAQDVDQILLDYAQECVVTTYDHRTGEELTYNGVAGVQNLFVGLFAKLTDLSDLAAPVETVNEDEHTVFLIWTNPASGIISATDTFIFDENFKITRQNVVFTTAEDEDDQGEDEDGKGKKVHHA